MHHLTWRRMRRFVGWWTVPMLVDAMEKTPDTIRHHLRLLVNKGSVEAKGYGWARRYRATNVRPEDMRGTSVNSLRMLQQYSAAVSTHRGQREPARRERATIELEKAWRSNGQP